MLLCCRDTILQTLVREIYCGVCSRFLALLACSRKTARGAADDVRGDLIGRVNRGGGGRYRGGYMFSVVCMRRWLSSIED